MLLNKSRRLQTLVRELYIFSLLFFTILSFTLLYFVILSYKVV